MSDVGNKQANFSALLVYDVSRWGRFQDVDESAYYEYVLKRAGIGRNAPHQRSYCENRCNLSSLLMR